MAQFSLQKDKKQKIHILTSHDYTPVLEADQDNSTVISWKKTYVPSKWTTGRED